jgi:DNA helicase-2/ATP-dependent DNA helicase PcrA
LLAYLQLIDNPSFVPALTRAINVPSRGIGEKVGGKPAVKPGPNLFQTVIELLARADKTKRSPLDVIEQINDAKQPDIKPAVKRKLGPFVKTVRTLRKLANEVMLRFFFWR